MAAHNIGIDRDAILELHSEFEPQAQSQAHKPYRTILPEVVSAFGERLGFTPTDAETSRLAESIEDWPAFSDSTASLRTLKSHTKLAIISNIDNDLIKLSTDRLKIDFDWVVTSQNAQCYKPSVSVFNYAFEAMNLDSREILHVAQSLYHDIAPANKLGMQCVWVNRRKGLCGTGTTPTAEAKPTLEVGSLVELADIMS